MIRQPSSVIIARPSGSGKSDFVEQWLRYLNVFQVKPQTMVYAYDQWQPRFDRMQRKDGIPFYRGLPDPSHLTKWIGPTRGGVLVLDDLTEEVEQDKRVLDLSTKDSHHRNITVLYLTQDLFPPGKFSKTINRNAHYIVAFKITHGIKRAYGPFYFKPFLTVGIKPCAYSNASRRTLLDI